MTPFRPAEIRIIVFLILLALAGSVVTLLQRQGKIASLNLGALTEKSDYRYSYKPSDFPKRDSSAHALGIPSTTSNDTISNVAKIDLNHCGYYDFVNLPGIGPALASRIIAYRDSIGQFKTIDELLKVKGIGPAKFTAIKNKVSVE
jgi:competence ComEA-like helix-hairpin-helix protein